MSFKVAAAFVLGMISACMMSYGGMSSMSIMGIGVALLGHYVAQLAVAEYDQWIRRLKGEGEI